MQIPIIRVLSVAWGSSYARMIAAGLAAGFTAALLLGGTVLRPRVEEAALSHLLARADLPAGTLDQQIPGEPVFYLLVGSDRRAGLPAQDSWRFGDVAGQRADAVELIRVDPDKSVTSLSLPRDLRVVVPGGITRKISAWYEDGAASLVRAVRQLTGAPVHHLIEVDFAAFVGLIDGLGGVDLDFPYAARDVVTRFATAAGPHHLDGQAALAYLRSRHYEEWTDGRWNPDESGDLGRITRRQKLIETLASRIGNPRSLPRSLSLLRTVPGHLGVDRSLSTGQINSLAGSLASGTVSLLALPARPALPEAERLSPFGPAHYGVSEYVVADDPAARNMLTRFRAGLPAETLRG